MVLVKFVPVQSGIFGFEAHPAGAIPVILRTEEDAYDTRYRVVISILCFASEFFHISINKIAVFCRKEVVISRKVFSDFNM